MLDLKELLVDTKSTWVEYPGLKDFMVEVAMLSRPELTKLRKKSLITKMDRKTRTPIESLDEDKFVSLFAKATIKNWKGLTLKHLSSLVLVDIAGKDETLELEYSVENAEMLISNSSEFDSWINEVVFDLNNFRS